MTLTSHDILLAFFFGSLPAIGAHLPNLIYVLYKNRKMR